MNLKDTANKSEEAISSHFFLLLRLILLGFFFSLICPSLIFARFQGEGHTLRRARGGGKKGPVLVK